MVRKDGTAETISVTEPTGKRVFVSHNRPAAAADRLRERGYEVTAASGGAISVAPLIPGVCAGLRLVRENPDGVSIRGRIGALIAAEAGALVMGATGPFPDSIREPAEALLTAVAQPDLDALYDALSVA